ncbi:MAG: rhomboid family intramembrane serine protease [Fibromonadaceae bacterium]|jgi:membrane associated rhomboid family serine protease|nr:rhomboid family intramembrane serine protease [Fibromonadaceae bacterium]
MQRDGARPSSAWSFVLPSQKSEIGVCLEQGVLRVIKDFSLVLSSQNINHNVTQNEHGPWEIHVQEEELYAAQTQITLYKQENPDWERETIALPMLRPSLQPLWFLLIPVVCTFFQFSNFGITDFGLADAGRILKGEWWRLFTAQTLHSSNYHLVSNLISGFFVFSLISFKMPLSRIAPFIILAAACANLETALIMKNYRSLGFSTTVFAGLGALATLEVRVLKKERLWRRMVPWFAAFLLSVFLGVGHEGSRTDIPGHFLGLAMGAIAGFAPPKKWLRWGEPLGKLDIAIVFTVYAFFTAMWIIAIK